MNTVGRISVVSILIVGIILVGRLSLIDSEENRTVSSLTWSGCGGGNYFTVSNIKIEGDFSEGSVVNFITTGAVVQQFTHTSSDIKITLKTLFPIKVYDENVPADPSKAYVPGPLTLETKNVLQQSAPAGGYTVEAYIRGNESNDRLQCVKINFTLK